MIEVALHGGYRLFNTFSLIAVQLICEKRMEISSPKDVPNL